MLYMFRTVLVHHQEQLYKLYIAFGTCRCMRCTAYKVAPDDGLIQSETCRASNRKYSLITTILCILLVSIHTENFRFLPFGVIYFFHLQGARVACCEPKDGKCIILQNACHHSSKVKCSLHRSCLKLRILQLALIFIYCIYTLTAVEIPHCKN
jgi:hypothetical protein